MWREQITPSGLSAISVVNGDGFFFENFTVEGVEPDMLGLESVPKRVDASGLCICLQGEVEIASDGRSYLIKAGDLCVVFPNTILQIIRKSPDFKGYTMAGTSEFMKQINISSSTAIYLEIKVNPCISLSEEEQNMLLTLCEMLKEKDMRKNHIFRHEITRMLLNTLVYEIAAIFQKGKPLERQTYSSKNTIFIKFQHLIATHYHEQRTIEFYAEQLCITPRYLSSITKEVSGLTAAECITRIVMVNARLLLKSTKLSIQQVSEELNFPNPSFFGQYFKKRTGLTPKEYRNLQG